MKVEDLKIEYINSPRFDPELGPSPAAVKVTDPESKKTVTVDLGKSIQHNLERAVEILSEIRD